MKCVLWNGMPKIDVVIVRKEDTFIFPGIKIRKWKSIFDDKEIDVLKVYFHTDNVWNV
mgnify:FL=1